MLEFSTMVLGAIVTYVKAIVGLAVLFGIAPIFVAFYLFEKTRGMTMSWLSMVFGFALQPVMLFAFLAFYATIVGGALTNMLSDASGNPNDICYVPWYSMPRLFDIYWWKFTNSAGAAGGMVIPGSGASGSDEQLPTQVLNVLYFVVLCNLGKNFCNYINELSTSISGGSGAGVVTGENVGSWFKGGMQTVKRDLSIGGVKGGTYTGTTPAGKSSFARGKTGGGV
jgi:type IV secretion system protein VirB6